MAKLSGMLLLAWSSLPFEALSTGVENGDADLVCTTHGTCDVSLDETSAMQIKKGTSGIGQPLGCRAPVKFFDVDKVQDEVPLPPSTYPEELQGLMWMDQSGSYGLSDLNHPAPDYIVSFADPIKPWSPEEKTISIAPWGKTWTWFNTVEGYTTWGLSKFVNYIYNFNFNADLTHAKVLIEITLGPFGTYTVPDFLLSATMHRLTPPQGACPPPPGATKKQISQCATWRRDTTILPGWFLIGQPTLNYYIFTIVDNKGNKMQPYFDAYAKFAALPQNNQNDPDAAKKWLGVNLEKVGGTKPAQSFVGTQSKTIPGINACNPDSPCKHLFSPSSLLECVTAALADVLVI